MNLVVNGCSFTNWYRRQDTWAHYIHLQYPDLNFINLGKRGSTNDEIILNTISELSTLKEKSIVIIQLSGLDRILIDGERSPTVSSAIKSKLFNWWSMSQSENVSQKWIDYFNNEYSEEKHFNNLLNLLIRFQSFVNNRNNIDYRIFCGWDIFTQGDEKSDMWNEKIKYKNFDKLLVKDVYKSSEELFNKIDCNNFWFYEDDKVKCGGLIQWVQNNLNSKDWYRNVRAIDPDYHPSDLAHKEFSEKIIIPLMEEML